MEKINGKKFSDDAIKTIISDIHDLIRNNDLGKSFYRWLIDPNDKIKLIDLDNFDINFDESFDILVSTDDFDLFLSTIDVDSNSEKLWKKIML